MLKKIGLQVAYGAVKHFGRNLYTSNPPAIAELVANAWDAYATQCFISVDSSNTSLLIMDNGIGMTDKEFETRYAVSGTEKPINEIRIPEGVDPRPYMGRKGIGKFSAFSLGNEYILYTKSIEDKMWKKIELKYEDMIIDEAIKEIPVYYQNDLSELAGKFSEDFSTLSHGTIIYIPTLRRKSTKATWDGLSNTLSRRFSANISDKYDFKLVLNSSQIDLTAHYYDNHMEFVYYFGYSPEEIKRRFKNVPERNFFPQHQDFFEHKKIKGWIGTVELPKNLKLDDDSSFGGVVVYINGKLAEENIFKNSANARISDSYIIGEIDADYLQNESEDPVLSSREGLNYEIENVSDLLATVGEVRQKLINDWNHLRANRDIEKQEYLQKMLADKSIKMTYDTFNGQQKKKFNSLSQKVFDKNEQYSESEYKMFAPVLLSIINGEMINQIHVDPENDIETILKTFYDLFDKTEVNAALRIKSNISERLKIIAELNSAISDEAIESVFEEHLAAHPWLIDPYWDKPSDKLFVETQNRFKTLVADNQVIGRTDIIIRVAEEPYPIICELKREKSTGYSTPDVGSIKSQIGIYRTMVLEKLRGEGVNISNPQDIKAYFICGDAAYNKLVDYQLNDLKNDRITILTYQNIIQHAEGVYHNAIS